MLKFAKKNYTEVIHFKPRFSTGVKFRTQQFTNMHVSLRRYTAET